MWPYGCSDPAQMIPTLNMLERGYGCLFHSLRMQDLLLQQLSSVKLPLISCYCIAERMTCYVSHMQHITSKATVTLVLHTLQQH